METNFYLNTQTESAEFTEVYFGQYCGKQLNQDIQNSKSEVLIISPYIDETKLEDLIKLKEKKVNVRIIFNSLRKDQERKILRKLIHQNKENNYVQKEIKEKQHDLYLMLSIVCICIGVVLFLFSIQNMKIDFRGVFYMLISFASSYGFWYFNNKRELTKKIQIYKYTYSEKLDFKYLRDNKENKMEVHSKIYVIDRKVAYLGSLNFTNDGFNSNFETIIKITQKDKIMELVKFANSIFEDNVNFKSNELWLLGKKAYSEEKYLK
ncbi:phospholipase D-like domain-containing protein [Flavobacterium sp. MC2016-06]|uniref:phospholipase D-like domain-containing protein n=1 Tax=Flavobacterium sp. MC2016-06 TaxID=2676308 RepID=UPI0012BAD3A6|nr:phospholipase D-like domain-containing protein [Flavobacterium sp. MC2016-06]MBU3857827.1 phospholipase D family protein [Flavobacterium sp. MC2016-06]